MDVVSSEAPISFVARPAYFATSSPDSTLVVFSISLPNRGLTFQRDGALFRAQYEVNLILKQGVKEIQRVDAVDTVRVATLKETRRTDESIVFRRVIRIPPGPYKVTYTVRDEIGAREATCEGFAGVPRVDSLSFSRPLVVYSALPRSHLTQAPQYLAAPRASLVFGVDGIIPVYIESYGARITTPVVLSLQNAAGATVWRDTEWVAKRRDLAAGVIGIPLSRADVGVYTIVASRVGAEDRDTLKTSVFIGFGPDLPVISFREMVSYLKYFTTPDRIRALKDAPAEQRGVVWNSFLHETDPIPETPQNEALQEYFRRIRDANSIFSADANQGWLSDRGSVYVALGEPDASYEQEGYWRGVSMSPSMTPRMRLLTWEYRDLQSSIIFYDETGSGQWRMLPTSESNFRTLIARRMHKD